MAIKKIIVNGTTNMDLSADTVTEQTLLSGYTAHKSDGTQITGTYVPTVGDDVPVYTITYDTNYDIESITCNKTYSNISTNDYGYAKVIEVDEYGSNPAYTVQFGRKFTTYILWVWGAGHPIYDLKHNDDNTIDFIMPSRYAQTLSATANGTYTPSDSGSYVSVNVNVPAPTLQTKTTTPTTSSQTITPDTGYDGLSSVTVNAIPSQYIVPTGTISITSNQTGLDVSQYASADINVPSSVTYTATIVGTGSGYNCYVTYNETNYYTDGDTFTYSSGDTCVISLMGARAYGNVYLNDEIISSNQHNYTYTLPDSDINIELIWNPNASYEYAYIYTPIIPTGTLSITSNGQSDVRAYRKVNVNVPSSSPTLQSKTVTPTKSTQTVQADSGYDGLDTVTVNPIPSEYIIPTGSQTITENGTVDVSALAQVVVNVTGGGGGGLEYETGTWSPDEDIARGTISFVNSHSEPPVGILLADATSTPNSVTNTNMTFVWWDYERAYGTGIPYSSGGYRYASALYNYRGTSTSSVTQSGTICSQHTTSTTASGVNYPKYWATASEFHPYTGSTSRYWRAGRTYKWIAIWKPTT